MHTQYNICKFKNLFINLKIYVAIGAIDHIEYIKTNDKDYDDEDIEEEKPKKKLSVRAANISSMYKKWKKREIQANFLERISNRVRRC